MIKKGYIDNKDCLEFMGELDNNSIDLIIADPPYYKVVSNMWDNQWKSEKDYLNWCREWIKESIRVLKENGSIVIWGQLGENHIVFARLLILLEDEFPELTRKNIITVKRTKGQGTKTNFMSNREEFVWLVKNPKDYTFNKQYTLEVKNKYGYKGNKDKPDFKVAGNVWSDIIYPWFGSKTEKYVNTAQKPLLACERIIKALTNEGDLVYIPFVGSGSEVISCIHSNRTWLGTEIDIDNIKIAYERIEKEGYVRK